MSRVIISDKWLKQLCESQGIPWTRTTRIIIDAKAGSPIWMYVTQFGDDGLLKLTPPEVVPPELTEAGT